MLVHALVAAGAVAAASLTDAQTPAADIPPGYEVTYPADTPPRVSRSTLGASAIVAASFAAAGILVPMEHQPRVLPIVGVVAGATAIVLGIRASDNRKTTALAIANLSAGFFSAFAASQTISTRRAARESRPVTVAPILDFGPAGGRAAGLAFSFSF